MRGERQFWRDNGLSLAMLALFVVCWLGQSVAGWRHYNDDQQEHGQPAVGYGEYVRSPEFMEATFENWESEFFQMAAFVVLAGLLVQRGSGESKEPENEKEPGQEEDAGDELAPKAGAPGPVMRGGIALRLYSHSLSLTLFALFVVSFLLHAASGRAEFNEEARTHGQPEVTLLQFLGSSTFWFQSLQNWQSEFLSVAVLVLLSIVLREKGSPESKPVNAPHSRTGK
jgi:hypothetical protein